MAPRNPLLKVYCLLLSSLLLLVAPSCGGGKSSTTGDGPPPDVDTTAPFTQASPAGGLYPATFLVTLSSNEGATIYYTTDGSTPAVGGITTLSGPSPVNVPVTHGLSLKFFGVDDDGNVESVRSEDYSFDTNPPIVLLGGGLPTTLAFLEQGVVNFSVDELESSMLSWTAELGGTSTPGTGTAIAAGTTPPSTLTQFSVPGWELPIGGSTTLHLFVQDAAGGLGFQPIPLSGRPDELIALPGESGAMAITSDSNFLYIARPVENKVLKYGARPGTLDYHVEVGDIAVGTTPSSLSLTSDDSRVYLTCADGIYEVDVATDAVVGPIAVPGGALPSGGDLSPDGTRLYFATDGGRVYSLNTDPLSGGYLTSFNSFTFEEPLMTTGELDVSPDGTRATLAWSGNGWYGVYYIDTDPTAASEVAFLVSITNAPANLARATISQDGTRAWLGDGLGKLAVATLAEAASGLSGVNSNINAFGLTPAPDESLLMLSGGGLVGLRLADPDTLELAGFVTSGSAGAGGTGRHLAFSPDGKRAYMMRNQGSPSGELQVLRIQP